MATTKKAKPRKKKVTSTKKEVVIAASVPKSTPPPVVPPTPVMTPPPPVDPAPVVITTIAPPPITETSHQSMGPVIVMLGSLLLLTLGGLYLWGSSIQREQRMSTPEERVIPNNEPETVRSMTDSEILETVSSSDELSVIDADLGATNLESLGKELIEMENEINSMTP